LENEHVKENDDEELIQLVDFEEERWCEEETSENEHVEENAAEELVQLVNFQDEG
jgi:hypothetical protein